MRRNLMWWMLAIVAAMTLWWVYEQVPRPGARWEILDDLKFRFPVPKVPNPWRR